MLLAHATGPTLPGPRYRQPPIVRAPGMDGRQSSIGGSDAHRPNGAQERKTNKDSWGPFQLEIVPLRRYSEIEGDCHELRFHTIAVLSLRQLRRCRLFASRVIF